jgi:hypothetical protein
VFTFLNENEFLALFVLIEGENSFRAKLAKRFFRGIIVNYWQEVRLFIMEMRERRANARLFTEFEKLAEVWREQESTRYIMQQSTDFIK